MFQYWTQLTQGNIPKLLTWKIYLHLIQVTSYGTQTDCDVIFPIEGHPYSHWLYRDSRRKIKLLTYSTIYIGHIKHSSDDIITEEVTMTLQKLINQEINQNGAV